MGHMFYLFRTNDLPYIKTIFNHKKLNNKLFERNYLSS